MKRIGLVMKGLLVVVFLFAYGVSAHAESDISNGLVAAIKQLTPEEASMIITPFAAAAVIAQSQTGGDACVTVVDEYGSSSEACASQILQLHMELLAKLNRPLKWLGRCGDEYDTHEEWLAAEVGTISCP